MKFVLAIIQGYIDTQLRSVVGGPTALEPLNSWKGIPGRDKPWLVLQCNIRPHFTVNIQLNQDTILDVKYYVNMNHPEHAEYIQSREHSIRIIQFDSIQVVTRMIWTVLKLMLKVLCRMWYTVHT